jgi:hypothetical protein
VRFLTDIAWTWYVVIGSLTTFAAGWLLGLLMPPAEPRSPIGAATTGVVGAGK